ncbi:MAG TPA: transposase [Rhizomicrobium sp.]|nr:transposase [Rhizomicrobium sp.]
MNISSGCGPENANSRIPANNSIAPAGNFLAPKRRAGAPNGNRNAWKHGRRSAARLARMREYRRILRSARAVLAEARACLAERRLEEMLRKLREAIAAQDKGTKVSGDVEIDGMHIGGHVKPANPKENRIDRRLAVNQDGKRRVVIVARERNGKTITFVTKSEAVAVPMPQERIEAGSTVYADEASHWDVLHTRYDTRRIDHSEAYGDLNGCSTNMAESFVSRLRRAELGTHHHGE